MPPPNCTEVGSSADFGWAHLCVCGQLAGHLGPGRPRMAPLTCLALGCVFIRAEERMGAVCLPIHQASQAGSWVVGQGSRVLRAQACRDSWEMPRSWHSVPSAAVTAQKPVMGHSGLEKWGMEERSHQASLQSLWTQGGMWTWPSLQLPHLLLH